MRRHRVVWSSSPEPALFGRPPRRPGGFRRTVRTGLILTVLGLTRAVRSPRWRCAMIGAALTIPGVILRQDVSGDIMLLPGLMTLFYAPFLPGETPEIRRRQARLRRELAAYSTASERRDLEALLSQYGDGETTELRAILANQELARARSRFPGLGQP